MTSDPLTDLLRREARRLRAEPDPVLAGRIAEACRRQAARPAGRRLALAAALLALAAPAFLLLPTGGGPAIPRTGNGSHGGPELLMAEARAVGGDLAAAADVLAALLPLPPEP